jgi:hypothetical protein
MNFKTLVIHSYFKNQRQNHVFLKFSSPIAMFSCSPLPPPPGWLDLNKARLQKCPIFLESLDHCLPGTLLPIPQGAEESSLSSETRQTPSYLVNCNIGSNIGAVQPPFLRWWWWWFVVVVECGGGGGVWWRRWREGA